MNYRFAGWVVRVLFCGVLLFPAVSIGAPEEKVSLNFVNADIEEVIKAVSHITGRNFLIDPRVKGTINIVSSTPIPASLAYDILLSALRMQGFAAVESGGVTKLMPEADAKLHVSSAGDGKSSGDRLVTRVYVLKYESAVQLVPILRPLIAPNNIIVAYPNGNALVVTDYASNLKRIEQIVESIDQPNADTPIIIPIKHASAADIAQTINRVVQNGAVAPAGGADASTRFVLVADSRTNSLLLSTDNPARVERVRDLVEKLDTDSGTPGNIHVVYLKNAEATKVAQTLRSVISGDTSAPAAAATGTGAAATANATPAPAGGGMVQADIPSNSLIITAPAAVYNNLRSVIDMLDVRRAEVYIEALIAEVEVDKAAQFGIQWQSLAGIGGGGAGIIGGTNFGTTGNIIGAATGGLSSLGQGLNIGIANGTVSIPGATAGTTTQVLNLGMLATALENDTTSNVLSAPNLLTLDNEEAKIIVGQNVPFITGSYAQTGSTATATPFQTIERKDVGLTLRIKPQVSEGGAIKLQIYQEVSSVDQTTLTNSAGVTTNKRSLDSIVLVDDGQIVVLGGLMQDSVSNTRSKVPVLGDIPWIGNLFRYDSRSRTKTDLMVFLRPHVLRSAEEAQGLTQSRYDYLRGEQKQTQLPPSAILPDIPAPLVPPLELKQNLPAPQPASQPAAPDVPGKP
jgi:general secretion pathway protein D